MNVFSRCGKETTWRVTNLLNAGNTRSDLVERQSPVHVHILALDGVFIPTGTPGDRSERNISGPLLCAGVLQ